jgi:hypothetical protein
VNKIIVTEEQAELINEGMAFGEIKNKFDFISYRCYGMTRPYLTLTEIARIVEGAPYEIKREFKVGDIIMGNESGNLKEVSENMAKNLNSNNTYFTYTLICRAEHREDLKGELE